MAATCVLEMLRSGLKVFRNGLGGSVALAQFSHQLPEGGDYSPPESLFFGFQGEDNRRGRED